MLVAHLLYPGFNALDVVGTFQVLAAAPGTRSVFVGDQVGAVIDDTALCPLTAPLAIADLASADLVVVPGSDCAGDPDPGLVEWLRPVTPLRPGRSAGPRGRPPTPYDAGTPAKAPADIGELVSSYYAQRCS